MPPAGVVGRVLLLQLLPLVAAAATPAADTSPLAECQRLHAAGAQPLPDMLFWTGSGGEDFGLFRAVSPAGWLLDNFLRFHALDPVEETAAWTVLCVGLVDTTAHSYEGTGQNHNAVAWATLHTKRQVAAGLLRLGTRCWLGRKNFAACSPSFTPFPYVKNLPLYHFSPLEELFWTNLTTDAMDVKPYWIWRINTETKNGSIHPHWISNMHIPSLLELDIHGNDWRRPERILYDLPELVRLNLGYNNLEIVPEDMYTHIPNISDIVLGHNNISKFPSNISHLTKLKLLDMTNPIGNATLQILDEDLEHIPKSLEILGLENTKLIVNATNILLLPELKFLNLSGCAVKYIDDDDDDDDDDDETTNATSELITIDLSNNELEELPYNIFSRMLKLKSLILATNNFKWWPEDLLKKNELTYFDLSHNEISNLTSNTFINFKKLEKLVLSWNKIENISSTVFHNTQGLKYLDLSHNKLTFLPDMLFNYTPQLAEINLSNNMLKDIPHLWEMHIKVLDLSHNNLTQFKNNKSDIEKVDLSYNNVWNLNITSVQKINISYNSISYISPNMWAYFSKLKEIDVGGNDFECCRFKNRTFVFEQYPTLIQNLGTVDPLTCSINQTSPKILLQTFVYNETECLSPKVQEVTFGIAVVLPVTVLIVTIGLIAVTMYVYRFELTYVSHLFRMKKVGAETDEQRYKTCVYDAFVCYSARNFEWVTGTLLPGLEGGPEGYRLCVHDRDFALGAGINCNIVASLEKSRKVIFVLSKDFIVSKWCQWELEMANHKMFEEKRNYIILVELERLDHSALPRHLRYLMDRTTYLEWPEEPAPAHSKTPAQAEERRLAACFRRLREALGDSLRQRTGRDNEGFFTVLDAP